MESFNKLISFVLGLVVVVVFLLIISGKIDIRKKIIGQKITPTPTPQEKLYFQTSPTPMVNNYQNQTTSLANYQPTNTKQIPATGVSTIFIPLVFSTFGLGVVIKKRTNA